VLSTQALRCEHSRTKLPEPMLTLFEQLALTDHIPQPQPGAAPAAVEAVTPSEWEALASHHGDESLGKVIESSWSRS
jgi:hypothetical protein